MKTFRNVTIILAIISITELCLTHCQRLDTEMPKVNLRQGEASGKIMQSINGKMFNAFLGIPYGKVVERFMVGIFDSVLQSFIDIYAIQSYFNSKLDYRLQSLQSHGMEFLMQVKMVVHACNLMYSRNEA